MLKKLNLITLICVALFSLCSCSDDDNNGIEIGSYGYLIVNGARWDVGISAPNYYSSGYAFFSLKPQHLASFELNDDLMTGASVGDDVTAPEVNFGLENALYKHVSGNVEVVKVSGDDITLKFNDYTIVYQGKFISGLDDGRQADLVDKLVMSGTVEFIHNTND